MPSPRREMRLASRPDGAFEASNWELAESTVPEPSDGEFLVDVTHISGNPAIGAAAPPAETWIGRVGDTGLPAYCGLLEVGAMEPGDTVVVSAAAGAVGGVAGQIARIKGGRAIGIAGGPEKCRHVVEELGFAAAI